MQDEKIRALLVYMLTQTKATHQLIAGTLSELSAIHGAVEGLDPTFGDVLEQKRQEAQESLDEVTRDSIAQYDEMIRRISSGEFV